jgi:hypothetical protein
MNDPSIYVEACLGLSHRLTIIILLQANVFLFNFSRLVRFVDRLTMNIIESFGIEQSIRLLLFFSV